MRAKLVYTLPLIALFWLGFIAGAAAQPVKGGYKMQKIVLDAGHGGKDPGASGGGHKEKDVVLAVTLRVGALIEEHLPGVEVVYTRKTDIYIDPMARAAAANRHKADLFVSIHADAVKETSANGSSSWVMGLSREESNLQLAMRENSVITYEDDYQTKYEGFDPNDPVSYIMFSLMQSAHFDQSIRLARLFQSHYLENTTIRDRGVDQNIFMVLHRTTMPSVLTEIGFISNEKDRKYMTSKAGQEQIARSIFEAIGQYKAAVEENARIAGTTSVISAAPASPEPPAPAERGRQRPERRAPEVIFRIQVSALPTRAERSRFGSYARQIEERKIGDYYKYFVGATDSYAEALSLQRRVQRQFRDAFIVAFENDRPVTITEEMKK